MTRTTDTTTERAAAVAAGSSADRSGPRGSREIWQGGPPPVEGSALDRVRWVREFVQWIAEHDRDQIGPLDARQCEELIREAVMAGRALIAVRSTAYRAADASQGWKAKGDASLGAYAGRVTAAGPRAGAQQVAWSVSSSSTR